MTAIPLVDLAAQYEDIRDEVIPAMERVMRSARFILGEEVELFEERFAAYCGADHCVGVSSGTEALHLALRALDIGPGDEVITTANTFAATAFAIAYTGASPVLVDVQASDYNMDVALLRRAITSRTKAIVPVHLYGQPAEMGAILAVANEHGLHVVEDACQAHGARYRNRPVGSLGDAGCFSFYPGKNLGAYGDGGAVVTNRRDLLDRLRSLRNYGQHTKGVHSALGFNSRLDTLQAAVLLVKLNYLDTWNERRRVIAEMYGDQLSGCDVVLPAENPGVRHVYHLYIVQHEQRDDLLAHLKTRDIACGIHYPIPLHQAAAFASARTVPEGVPVCTALSRRILSLPIYPEMNDAQVEQVVDGVKSFRGLSASVLPVPALLNLAQSSAQSARLRRS